MSMVEMEQLEIRERHRDVFTTGAANDRNKQNWYINSIEIMVAVKSFI